MKRTEYLRTRIESHNYYVEIGPRIMSASTSQLTQIAAESWLAVGDAAAAYDPLSSQGIKTALEMAVEGAKAILQRESRSVSRYVQAINHTFAEYLANRRLYYARERRWPDSPFWKRRWALPLDAAAAREASSSSLA
jgi:flavin-dependent dehydrogenase